MNRKIMILCGLAAAAAAFYALGFHQYMTLDGFKARYAEVLGLYERRPALVVLIFMLVQITALTLSLPGAVLTLALAGGAIFGPYWGTAIVLTSITLGDSFGFLAARYLLRDWVQRRFGHHMAKVERGVEEDGAFYLLSLRLMAVVPFFVVNVTMGLTRMPLKIFAPVSFIGLMPATALYVNAGTALAEIESPADIVSVRLILSLTLLGLFPLAARFAFKRLSRR